MFRITKIYKIKPKNKKYSNILIGIKDESMKGSKEILIRGLVETGDIQPEPDKLDILIQEFSEFKKEFREFKSEMTEFKTKQEKFNKTVVNQLNKQEKFNEMVLDQFKKHKWIK